MRMLIATVAATACHANATTLGFGIDESDRPRVTSEGDSLSNGSFGAETGSEVELLIRQSRDRGQFVTQGFVAGATLTHVSSTDRTSDLGYWVHEYSATGGVQFFGSFDLGEGTNVYRLAGFFENAVFTATGDENSWDSAAVLEVADSDLDNIEYRFENAGGSPLPAIDIDPRDFGIFQGASVGPDELSFALSGIAGIGAEPGSGVALGANGLPSRSWGAALSYTGATAFVPAPGTATALLATAGLASRRRR